MAVKSTVLKLKSKIQGLKLRKSFHSLCIWRRVLAFPSDSGRSGMMEGVTWKGRQTGGSWQAVVGGRWQWEGSPAPCTRPGLTGCHGRILSRFSYG